MSRIWLGALSVNHRKLCRLLLAIACTSTATASKKPVASFASDDDLLCAESKSVRIAESSLAIFKSQPTGSLFKTSFTALNTSCSDRGFRVMNPAANSCLPSTVNVAFRQIGDTAAWKRMEARTLTEYAARFQLSMHQALLMTNCTCHPESAAFVEAGAACQSLTDVVGSWVHRDPYNQTYDGMMCDEGPFVLATRSLSVLKSSPQLAMHLQDQIAPIPCRAQGYPTLFPPMDHCYPPMHIWTRSPIATDPGVQESVKVEKRLTCNYSQHGCTSGGFVSFAKHHRILDVAVLNNNLACNCLARSTVGKQVKGACWSGRQSDGPHSPVRDFWDGAY